ncbi:TM1812 family CRISPR-associated protein [bacterium]|nr:TM1812 family CRISPR-associated protein [bacterium]
MSRKSYRNTKVILIFIVLLAIAWAFNKTGLPFAQPEIKGARNTDKLQEELLYQWDTAKRSNYNAQFNLSMGVKNFSSIADSLSFLDQYIRVHSGKKLSKYEYLVRVPVSETDKFYDRITDFATVENEMRDYSIALTSGSVEAYNDSLKVLAEEKVKFEKLKKENPNIKGYSIDIENIDKRIDNFQNLKKSLEDFSNQEYDLYLVALSEVTKKGVNSSEYARVLGKHFIIALGVLALGVPLIMLGSKLLFKVLGIVGASTSQLYGSYYNRSYKYGNYGGYGYNYGRKRQVKRVYKDKPKGDEKSPDK